MTDPPGPPTWSLARCVAIVALIVAAVVVSFPVATLASVWGASALDALDHKYESLLADPKPPDVAIQWDRFSHDGVEGPQQSELFVEANRRTLTLRFELSVPEDHPLSALVVSGAAMRHPGEFMNAIFGSNPTLRRPLASVRVDATQTEIGITHIVARAQFPTWGPVHLTYRPGDGALEYGTHLQRVTIMTKGLLVRTAHHGRPAQLEVVSPETIGTPDFAAVYGSGRRFAYGKFRIELLPPPTAAAWFGRVPTWSLPAPVGQLAVEALRLTPLLLLLVGVSRRAPSERWRPGAYTAFFATAVLGFGLGGFIFTRDLIIDHAIRVLLSPVINHDPNVVYVALVPTILLGGLILPGLARRAELRRADPRVSMMGWINRAGVTVWVIAIASALCLVTFGTTLRGRELLPSFVTHLVLLLAGAGVVFALLVVLLILLCYSPKGAVGRGSLLTGALLAAASVSRVWQLSGWLGEVTARALATLVLAGAGLGLISLTHLVYTKRVWKPRPHRLGWTASLAGIVVVIWAVVHGSIGLTWPDAETSVRNVLGLQLPLVAGLVMTSVEDARRASPPTRRPDALRWVGVALLGCVFFTPLARHLYVPVVFLLGGAFAWWLWSNEDTLTRGSAAERRRAWARLLEFRSLRYALARLTERGPEHIVGGERELDAHNQLARRLSRRVATLDPTDEAAGTMRAVFGHLPARDRWRAAQQLTVVALVIAAPWIGIDAWVELMAPRTMSFPGLGLVRAVATSVLFWSLHGFVLGYFWAETRGAQVFRKAAWTLLLLTLPWLPLTALQAPVAIRTWTDYLGTAGKQALVLAGLSLWVVWRSSHWATVTWRDRIEAFGLRPLISIGSVLLTAGLGIAVTIATDTLKDAITSQHGSVSSTEDPSTQSHEGDARDEAPSEAQSESATGGGTSFPTSQVRKDSPAGPSSTVLLACTSSAGDQVDGVVEIENIGDRVVDLDGWILRIGSRIVTELEGRLLDPASALRIHEGEGVSDNSDLFLERDSSVILEGRTMRMETGQGSQVASADCV